jgi:hypothetical protein
VRGAGMGSTRTASSPLSTSSLRWVTSTTVLAYWYKSAKADAEGAAGVTLPWTPRPTRCVRGVDAQLKAPTLVASSYALAMRIRMLYAYCSLRPQH